ncbi:MAG: FKBP-type peptidyl-prolyl cis-trans isomerase N-terminal domain-containing protein [Arenimonas sp.]
MKLRVLAATLAALSLTAGVALAQTAAPAKPPAAKPAAPAQQQFPVPDRATLGYALGYERGSLIVRSGADVDQGAVVRGLQDALAKKEPTTSAEKLGPALGYFEQKLESMQRAAFEKVSRENKTKSDAYMASNKTKPGVVTLPGGVQYRVVQTGTGAKPTAAGSVVAHMRAVLSNGGPLFDTFTSSPLSPPTLKVSEMPVGLREAVLLMPVGSRWEITIPPEKGIGSKEVRAPGGPNQVMVYDLQLVNIK